MVVTCVYCGEEKLCEGRTYHKFPLTDPENLQCWLQSMNLGSAFFPSKYSMLCSDHFEKECFQKETNIACLRPRSVPTLFGHYKSACVFCKAVKGQKKERTFRKFPLHNAELLEKWVAPMGLEKFIPSTKSLLCSDHFEERCFRKTGRNSSNLTLRDNAIPTIFKSTTNGETSAEYLKTPDDKEATKQNEYNGKRVLSGNVPSAKIRKSCSPSHSSVHLMTETLHDADEGHYQVNEVPSTSAASEKSSTPTCSRTPETPINVRRVRHTTHDHRYETTPRTMKRKLIFQEKKIKTLMKVKHVHRQHISRLKQTVTSLKSIVSELRKARSIPESGLACLDSIANTDVSQFLDRFIKNERNRDKVEKKDGNKRKFKCQRKKRGLSISSAPYPPALRAFAMTLHFYSPKAYGFVRHKFCKALPDPSTIRSWYSSIDGEPGFTLESLEALKLKVIEARKENKKVIVSFMIDEISIKNSILRQNGITRGYVDMGTEIESSDTLPEAKDALVMMVVALDGSWKLPIAYFLINGIDSETHSGLITDALIRLHDIGVEVISVTLDGPPEHFATMRALGADFIILDPKPFFPHPSTNENVYVIFDACHMLKLARNCLGELQILKDNEGNFIQWKFIEALANIQEEEGLRAGNKLRMAHIKYWKMKMKVALAAQTLSSSVADAIDYCRDTLKLKEFEGSEATVKFIRCIDRLFDFLNSRNPIKNGYKAALRASNEHKWREEVLSQIEYLKGVTDLTNIPMYRTRRYVAFVGFITAVQSVIQIFDLYVKPKDSQLKYLLTYKFSQDHLELFFCAIRSCGGWCPNPTSAQFVSAYKRLLVRHEIKAVNGNFEAMDSTKVLTVPSTRKVKVDLYDPSIYNPMANIRVVKKYGLQNNDDERAINDEFFREFDDFKDALPQDLSFFSRACVAHIGGWVVKKLTDERKPIVRCGKCHEALFQECQTLAEFEDNLLIQAKTRGGLIFPSESVVRICRRTEELLRDAMKLIHNKVPTELNFPALVCAKVLHDLLQPPTTLFVELRDHMIDDGIGDVNHLHLLAKLVCKTYMEVRMYAATSVAFQKLIGTKVRHHLTRQIIWQHQ